MPNKGTIIKRILKERDTYTSEELFNWRLVDLIVYLRTIKYHKKRDAERKLEEELYDKNK